MIDGTDEADPGPVPGARPNEVGRSVHRSLRGPVGDQPFHRGGKSGFRSKGPFRMQIHALEQEIKNYIQMIYKNEQQNSEKNKLSKQEKQIQDKIVTYEEQADFIREQIRSRNADVDGLEVVSSFRSLYQPYYRCFPWKGRRPAIRKSNYSS